MALLTVIVLAVFAALIGLAALALCWCALGAAPRKSGAGRDLDRS